MLSLGRYPDEPARVNRPRGFGAAKPVAAG
jgi:hypothetical protein